MTGRDNPDDVTCDCGCREWVEAELQNIRAQMAAQMRTDEIQVGTTDGPHVVITATDHMARVRLVDPGGSVSVELLADGNPETPHMAGITLVRNGDVHSSLVVIQEAPGNPAVCELVFDDPSRPGGWTVIDRDGLRVDE